MTLCMPIVIKEVSIELANSNTKNMIITEVGKQYLLTKDHGTRCAIGSLRTLRA